MKKKTVTKTVFESKLPTPEKKEILRTAAYARVSTLNEEQELSYESQCKYYQTLIEADSNKVLVGVYGDHGISGLHAKSRPELQRLLKDCREGKVDLIMTKSISRLGRNAAECSRIIDGLNDLGIPVIFEKENLRSDDPQLSLILKLLIATAQEESNSMSQAITWSYSHNVQNGDPTRQTVFGYKKKPRAKKTDPHVWEVYEPEAKKVRLMFQRTLEGVRLKDIIKELNQMERDEGSDYTWKGCRVQALLRNEAFKGDLLTNKYYKPDMLSKHTVTNHGEREQFYLEGHHDPIVTRELFDEVQIIMATSPYKMNRERIKNAGKSKSRKKESSSVLQGKH